MINLLPPDMKTEILAARSNTVLMKYLFTSNTALIVILAIFGGAFYINYMNQEAYKIQLAESEKKIASLNEVRKKTKEYNANLTTAKKIFSSEVRLSQLVSKVSAALPPGSVLNNVSLNLQELTKPISIVANVDSFEKASILKRNFEDSGLFKVVTLKDVTKVQTTEQTSGKYPFTVNLEATLVPSATSAAQAKGTGQ